MLPVNILRVLHIDELERRENIRLQNIERIMRDTADTFSLRDDQFMDTFRLTKDMLMSGSDNAIKRGFMQTCQFPGTIGAIDCTHVAMIAPTFEEHNYLNRKGFHSKNVQIISDYGLRILNVNAVNAGATHDSFIWRNSETKTVGDSGYPQQCWLMTPIVDAIAGTPEFAYTRAQIRARNCVERCIGALKSQFRCIMGERKLRYKPRKVGNIINVCVILHNVCVAGHLD
ncbi:hypothetical protein NQ314_008797 [Rhamnusium bicolor]|uniref:DDE Tnp4 domain-containing protein n=1 Tax=Rhamnusium bicolor TaxID=1586634 RepID=A0AAV8Y5R8_9CUCU|nr:hypothetical protein NQ314_008797 [Rhamnusium bicolor]